MSQETFTHPEQRGWPRSEEDWWTRHSKEFMEYIIRSASRKHAEKARKRAVDRFLE